MRSGQQIERQVADDVDRHSDDARPDEDAVGLALMELRVSSQQVVDAVDQEQDHDAVQCAHEVVIHAWSVQTSPFSPRAERTERPPPALGWRTVDSVDLRTDYSPQPAGRPRRRPTVLAADLESKQLTPSGGTSVGLGCSLSTTYTFAGKF